jgi:ketosteroid isomerase-like protein
MFGALVQRIGNRLAWRAYNRRDLEFLGRYLTDDVVYDVSGRPPVGGRWVGKAGYLEANRRWLDAHPSARIRVTSEALTRPFALGLTNTVFTEMEILERSADGRITRRRAVDVSRSGAASSWRHATWLDPTPRPEPGAGDTRSAAGGGARPGRADPARRSGKAVESVAPRREPGSPGGGGGRRAGLAASEAPISTPRPSPAASGAADGRSNRPPAGA